MIGIGRSDEIIIADGKFRPQIPELGADAICVLLWCRRGEPGSLHYFIAMFIRPGHKKCPVPGQATKSGQDICDNSGVGMTDVG
jgi:hypothetical protein